MAYLPNFVGQFFEIMSKTILVTGSKGQLGRSLSKITETNKEYNFVFIDKEEADITSKEAMEALFSQYDFFAVLHFAAYTAVDRAESQQEACELVNHKATEQIAKLCNQHSAKLLYISTDYVFDGTQPTPYLPTDTPNPLSVYGKTKLLGEQTVLANCKQSIIVRTSWLYSEFGNNFVKTMRRLGSEKTEIGVVFDQVGSPCYATDLAKAVMKLTDKEFKGQIFHFSNEGVCSWYDFARKTLQLSGLKCKVKPITTAEYPTAAARPSFSLLNKSDIKAFLSIDIPHWEDSLAECIKIMDK